MIFAVAYFLNKDLKVSGPEESGRIVAHENVHFSNGNYETNKSKLSLRMKMRNAELYLKGATVIYGLQPLAARLPELASKLERIDCFHWCYSEYSREYQSKLSTDHSSGEL